MPSKYCKHLKNQSVLPLNYLFLAHEKEQRLIALDLSMLTLVLVLLLLHELKKIDRHAGSRPQ